MLVCFLHFSPGQGVVLDLKLFVKMSVMLNQSEFHFLREKIQDLRSALFFSQNTSLLRISTTIVTILKVDELGQMWFFVPRPRQALHEFDREFPVKLEFFRKGKRFFLHILGKAFIVTDPEEINSLMYEDIKEKATDHLVLIKVKMSKVDYFESAPASQPGWWKDLRKQVHSWLFNTRPGYRPYHLETPELALQSF
jgi:general stress protein 26